MSELTLVSCQVQGCGRGLSSGTGASLGGAAAVSVGCLVPLRPAPW